MHIKKLLSGIEKTILRVYRSVFFMIIDLFLVNIAATLSLIMRFDFNIPELYFQSFQKGLFALMLFSIIMNGILGLYRSLWKFASVDELVAVFIAATSASVLSFIYLDWKDIILPNSFYLMYGVILMIGLGSIRFAYRFIRYTKRRFLSNRLKNHKGKRVLIYGAGRAGEMVLKEILNSETEELMAVGFLDDSNLKHNKRIHGVPVLGDRSDLRKVIDKYLVDLIIVAIPSASRSTIREISSICTDTKCKVKILPGMSDLIHGKVDIKQLRDVSIEDLLGREPIHSELDSLNEFISDKTVLITGGGGSIGSELCRQVMVYNPKKLIIFDIYENNAYDIQNELQSDRVKVLIGSVRDEKRLFDIFSEYQPEIIFHAAAHKHVPLMEDSPAEAFKNNVLGTYNVAKAAHEIRAEKMVLISTDKAVNPTNIMGATKRFAERVISAFSEISETEYVSVRFGNVLGSNGSVIPLFKKQIEKGGPVVVTHPEIIRYFMTIPEAVELVLQAGAMAKGGEIFVLDMGEPVKILTLAENLIKLSGLEPYKDIDIVFSGLRPGEKLYEELLMAEEGLRKTINNKIHIGTSCPENFMKITKELEHMSKVVEKNDNDLFKEEMKKFVSTYNTESVTCRSPHESINKKTTNEIVPIGLAVELTN